MCVFEVFTLVLLVEAELLIVLLFCVEIDGLALVDLIDKLGG